MIGGFSQGAVMAYALALAAGRPSPAGLLAMSGFIPEVEGFELDLARPGLPIAITHGTLDPVIGVEFARAARQRLEAAGNRLLYRESPVGHGIDPAVLPDLRAWLRRQWIERRSGATGIPLTDRRPLRLPGRSSGPSRRAPSAPRC